MLACPGCHRLVHADSLRRLAAEAEDATARGELSRALAAWRGALDLLPPASQQAEVIGRKVVELSGRVDAGPAVPARPAHGRTGWKTWGAGAAGLGLLVWKFKFVVVFVLSKLKFLLLGLTKSSTVFSMLLSLGVYWTAWGWKFAAGLVAAMYVHEMGHVAALRRFGIAATAPMFIPGLGALVRMKQYPRTEREDSRVGLAGPIWGLGAALVSYAAYLWTGLGVLGGIAKFAAWLNLFNLLPVWQLDGGRGFRSLTRGQRWLAVAAVAATWAVTREGLLLLILLLGAARAWKGEAPEEPDTVGLTQYASLIVALALLATIHIPAVAP